MMPIVVLHKSKVQLLPLRELIPHEEIIPRRIVELRKNIIEDKVIKRPIIVEEKTLTIIDGHHRYMVLRSIGAKLAPVILAKYNREIEDIKARPHTIAVATTDDFKALISIEGKIISMAKKGPARIILKTKKEEVELRRDPKDVYQAIKNFKKEDNSTGNNTIVEIKAILPPLTPKEILKTAMYRELLPPKSTIHQTRLKKAYAGIKLKYLY